MNIAFEITIDDVETVIENNDLVIPDGSDAESLFDDLDTDTVEHEALRGDSMDEQIKFAHAEILKQLEVIIEEAKNV